MQPLVLQIHNLLLKKKATISVAESCTGGLLSCFLTERSGSSAYFILGVVVYSNLAKQSILKVDHRLIRKKGAVSREVALRLAQNVRLLAGTDYAASITGIAGPTGGTAAKPVGTVFICVTSASQTICRRYRFKGSRALIRRQSALHALSMLRKLIASGR